MNAVTQTILGDGVYFGLAEDAYHADPALGSSSLRKLLQSPCDWWWDSPLNTIAPPQKEETESTAKLFGSALHKIILEGRDAFDRTYCRALDKKDYPDALVTSDQIKEVLKKFGLPISGDKATITARLLSEYPQYQVFDRLVADQSAGGKIVLPVAIYNRVMLGAKMITANPKLAPAFVKGMPEVSVFWTGSDGVRRKVRFDYLNISGVRDLKAYANMYGKPIKRAVKDAVWKYRYDMQASMYLDGRAQLPRLVEEGRVFGDVDMDWLRKVAAYKDFTFVWVFFKNHGAPISYGLQWHRGRMIDQAAQVDLSRAITSYQEHVEKFGDDVWIDDSAVDEMDDEDCPPWVGLN